MYTFISMYKIIFLYNDLKKVIPNLKKFYTATTRFKLIPS